jgi:hypothetical protein
MNIMTTMTFTYVCYLNLPSYDIHNHWRPKTMIYSTKPLIAHQEWQTHLKVRPVDSFQELCMTLYHSCYMKVNWSHMWMCQYHSCHMKVNWSLMWIWQYHRCHMKVNFSHMWMWRHIHIWLQFTFIWQLLYCHIQIWLQYILI